MRRIFGQYYRTDDWICFLPSIRFAHSKTSLVYGLYFEWLRWVYVIEWFRR